MNDELKDKPASFRFIVQRSSFRVSGEG